MAGALFGIAGHLRHVRGPAQGLDVLVQNLLSRRLSEARGSGRQDVGRNVGRIAINRIDRRSARREGAAMMAGPARDHLGAAEILLVDVVDHGHHAAGDLLFRLIVGIPLRIRSARADVAVSAAYVQGRGKQAHRSHELVNRDAFQNLNILESLFGHQVFWRLREGHAPERQHGAQPRHRPRVHHSFR